MDMQFLRETLGLTAAQIADELNLPRQDVLDCEETGATYLFARYVAAFPVNPELLKNANADPLLPGTDRSFPGNRMRIWREANGLSPERVALALEMNAEELDDFEKNADVRIGRSRGEAIERKTGINRKWLMYGDARNPGMPIIGALPDVEEESPKERAIRNEDTNKAGAERIRTARESAGLTRKDLSAMIGLSMSRISQIENGYVKENKVEEILTKIEALRKNTDTSKTAGVRIREARKLAGLSIRQAAELTGLKPASLTHMESGYVTGKRADEIIEALEKKRNSGTDNRSGKDHGTRIRDERKQVGLSQKELATILRIPVSRVGEIEMGNVTPVQAEEILRRIRGGPRRIQGNTPKIKPTRKVILGRNIRDARQAAGLSQKEAGTMIGVNQGRFSLIEKGEVDEATAAEILRKIGEYMNQSTESAETADGITETRRERPGKKKRS